MTDDLPAVVPAEVDSEILALRSDMKDQHGDYWTGPKVAGGVTLKQKRYGDLLAAKEGGQQVGQLAPPVAKDSAAAQTKSELLKHPDYWKRPDLQEAYLALCEAGPRVPTHAFTLIGELGMTEAQGVAAWGRAQAIDAALGPAAVDVGIAVSQLPDAVGRAMVQELAQPIPEGPPASPAAVEAFHETEAGQATRWGSEAPTRLARAQARWTRLLNTLDDNGKGWAMWLVDEAMTPKELAAVLNSLSR